MRLAIFFAGWLCAGLVPVCRGAAETGPVAWRPWEPATLLDASRLKRPIFLYIAAEWSPASRRMDRDVFTDREVAAMLNELFIPLRVEAARRPDVARRYQEAVRGLSGQAGWPLVLVLTPEGLPYFGGTAFRLEDDYLESRPGLRNVLLGASRAWRENAEGLQRDAAALDESLRGAGTEEAQKPAGDPDLDAIAVRMRGALDPLGGGFGPQAPGPKFPPPGVLELALLHHARSGEKESLACVTRTLDAMLAGGFHDRLGGGFHRHARDRFWRVPAFEKLLDLNAEMLLLCVHAWQATGEARYRGAGEGILRWLDDEMSDRARGGFYAAQSGADEAFYTWTIGEFEAALPDARTRALLAAHFDIQERGDLPLTHPYKNVLFEARPLAEAARKAEWDANEAPAALERGLDALRKARAARARPETDRTILVDANARTVSACLAAAEAWSLPAVRGLALKALDRILAEGLDAQHGAAHVLEAGKPAEFPFLARDEAALACACIDAALASGRAEYLGAAREALARLDERYRSEDGAYNDRAYEVPGAPPALGRLKEKLIAFQDTPGPSENALAALAQLRLAALLGDAGKPYAERAAQTLGAFRGRMAVLAGAGPALWRAADAAERGFVTVLLDGSPDDAGLIAMRSAAQALYVPQRLTVDFSIGAQDALRARFGLPPRKAGDPAGVYVIVGGKAALSAPDAASLRKLLEATSRR
ncbi:MAG: thioredoxin domain-containing protein [Planctomycetes bacterium]|nr:thioredoxin domain-containing protein [Planctomycetota bacterium]